jgi:hypothetical protein
MALLAVLRLGDDADGVPITRELKAHRRHCCTGGKRRRAPTGA